MRSSQSRVGEFSCRSWGRIGILSLDRDPRFGKENCRRCLKDLGALGFVGNELTVRKRLHKVTDCYYNRREVNNCRQATLFWGWQLAARVMPFGGYRHPGSWNVGLTKKDNETSTLNRIILATR